MKSIAKASQVTNSEPVLVGGKKQCSIRADDISSCDVDLPPSAPREVIGTHCRSLFIGCHGVEGMLYRVGEYLLVGDTDNADVIEAKEFFGVLLSNNWHSFVRGTKFEYPPNKPVHAYSGCPFVIATSIVKVFSSAKILRKLMLFPDPDSSNCFIVCDFMRPNIPLKLEDIIVPVYPEDGDMVNVRGDNDDMWFAHVLSVDPSARTCRIHFYIEDATTPGRFLRETLGRSATEIIYWNSIIGIASGHWVDGVWQSSNNLG